MSKKENKLKTSAIVELLLPLVISLVITVLNLAWWKVEYWGKEFVLLENSIDLGLWYFGILITLITIVHQGDNAKIRALREYKSINRLNRINKRAVFLSLFATVAGMILFAEFKDEQSKVIEYSFYVYNLFLFVWIWLLGDLITFLLVFYNLFHEN